MPTDCAWVAALPRAHPHPWALPLREQRRGGQHGGAEGAAAGRPQPHDPEGEGAAAGTGAAAVPARLKLDTVLELPVLHSCCLLAPQTRGCMKERSAYAVSSSDDEEPSKEIGVTYKSTRSAVRTGRGCGSAV